MFWPLGETKSIHEINTNCFDYPFFSELAGFFRIFWCYDKDNNIKDYLFLRLYNAQNCFIRAKYFILFSCRKPSNTDVTVQKKIFWLFHIADKHIIQLFLYQTLSSAKNKWIIIIHNKIWTNLLRVDSLETVASDADASVNYFNLYGYSAFEIFAFCKNYVKPTTL